MLLDFVANKQKTPGESDTISWESIIHSGTASQLWGVNPLTTKTTSANSYLQLTIPFLNLKLTISTIN